MPDFIGVYDNAVHHEMCKRMIDYFEENKTKHFRGRYMVGDDFFIDKSIKDSTDMTLDIDEECPPSTILRRVLQFYTDQYNDKYLSTFEIYHYSVDREYNMQRYDPGQGYHGLHCESFGPGNPRVLAWTLYLNTVTDGGGTYYAEYDKTIDAVEGRLCIFPAFWTHTHKGIVSNTETKYIATGWHVYHND
mgnify:FL=1